MKSFTVLKRNARQVLGMEREVPGWGMFGLYVALEFNDLTMSTSISIDKP
jgi:hypothetical protein